jgi:imidazolonepropionase-like amidohydrolase
VASCWCPYCPAGTDAGIAPLKPYDVLPYGLAELTALGMTNGAVLRVATSVAADACGLTGRKGQLIRGADADLVAVRGDPLRDIRAVHDVVAVIRAGRWCAHRMTEAMWRRRMVAWASA